MTPFGRAQDNAARAVAGQEEQPRLLTFRSGGWVLALAAFLCLAIIAWGIAGIFFADRTRLGDGSNPASYGFNLDHARVPLSLIVAAAEHRDFIRPLDHPSMITPAEADRYNEEERGKYLVSTDRIIGVRINGEARAYPLRMLDWHEVVNDTVGGVPIAVTYNGLCDSSVVFDRRVDEVTLSFASSGLLYNSNTLLFDRRNDRRGGESLWSQIQARAVTGEYAAADASLTILPAALTTWNTWRDRYPETLVLKPNPDPSLERYYKRRTYGHYFSSDELRFPVSVLPPESKALRLKDRVVAIEVGDGVFEAIPLRDAAKAADGEGEWRTTIGERDLRIEYTAEPESALVTDAANGALVETIHAFWFAWYALREAADE